MVFSSMIFLCVFFPVVFVLHQILPGIKAKNVMLVIASLLFYTYGEPIYIILMLISTFANYVLGRMLASDSETKRKAVIALTVIFNIGMLAVFKYADMAVESINYVFDASLPLPNIVLPIGISFYTFQAMSYVLDVYRREVEIQKNYFSILLYISFFPQLIAGPIVRYADIQKQIDSRHASSQDIAEGFRRFIVGLGKKVLISNVVAQAVDSIFATNIVNVNALAAWIAALSYMLQIYYDFSGYSDMAIGMGKIFGFHFKENFNYPYTAYTIKDFWRRWHISLSTWFREYLYFPLGGNRKGKMRTSINKFIVFFATGLWHGANWTFVLWGLWHGMFLFVEEYLPINKLPKIISRIYAMLVVCLGFVVFRGDTLRQGMEMIKAMFTGWNFDIPHMQVLMLQLTPLFIVVFILGILGAGWIQNVKFVKQKLFVEKSVAIDTAQYAISLVILVLCMLSLAGSSYNPFIYFRF